MDFSNISVIYPSSHLFLHLNIPTSFFFLVQTTCVHPLRSFPPFNGSFIVFWLLQDTSLISKSKDLKLGPTYKREHAVFVLLGLSYIT